MLLTLYSCKEALARLDDFVDRELSEREMKLVRRHLKLCHQCAKKFAFEAGFLEETRKKVQQLPVPEGLMAKLSQALSEAEE